MIFEKRLDVIRDAVSVGKKVSNKELMDLLDVSESTLRRDLDYLASTGEIKRVHGGAVLNLIEEETNYSFNETTNKKAKKIIGKKTASLINPNSHIFLDAGTTAHQVIDHLGGKNVTVVTNGLMHIDKLNALGIDTILLGGQIKNKTLITYGELTLRELNGLNFDLALIGANGIGEFTYTTADYNEAVIKSTAIEKANKAYVLADSSKIGKKFFADICKLDEAELIKED